MCGGAMARVEGRPFDRIHGDGARFVRAAGRRNFGIPVGFSHAGTPPAAENPRNCRYSLRVQHLLMLGTTLTGEVNDCARL